MRSLRASGLCFWIPGVVVFFLISGCGKPKDPWEGIGGSPRVITTFAPIYCMARNVALDDAAIACLCTNKGPHHYQYTNDDALYVYGGDLLLSNGLGLDDGFVDKMVKNGDNPKLRSAKLGDDLDPALLVENKVQHEGHTHGRHDPHVWLGIRQSIAMVNDVRDQFIAIDRANEKTYVSNAESYVAKLKELETEGRTALADLKDVAIVTSHESMTYFAESFDLNVVGSIRLSAGTEVESNKLSKLVQKCVDENVRIITIEPQYPDSAASTLLKELENRDVKGVRLVTLDPLETCNSEELSKDWYLRKMRENINNLASAIE